MLTGIDGRQPAACRLERSLRAARRFFIANAKSAKTVVSQQKI
jgi:hypothetical protein